MNVSVDGEPIHVGIKRTAEPAAEVFTTAEMKTYLKIDSSTDDSLIDAMIVAARQAVETYTGRALINQTWAFSYDGAPAWRAPLVLPVSPVSAVTSIKSYDTTNAEATMASGDYRLDTHSIPNRILLDDDADWPSDLRQTAGVLVTVTAGYGAGASSVTDKSLLHAIRLLVGHWYFNRSAVEIGSISKEIEWAFEALLNPLRVTWLG